MEAHGVEGRGRKVEEKEQKWKGTQIGAVLTGARTGTDVLPSIQIMDCSIVSFSLARFN
jgi:hypothetical protein